MSALLVVGCRRGGAALEPSNFSARAAESLLGAPAEVALSVDLAAIRGDDVYGPMLARSWPGTLGDDRSLRWLTSRVDRLDLWLVGVAWSEQPSSALAVFRGRIEEVDLGPRLLGLRLERRLVLPSGVVMFVVDTRGVLSAGFLLDGALVFATGAAMAPAQLHFSETRAVPAPLDWGPGALAGVYGRQTALAKALPGDPGHLVAGSAVWRDGRHGDLVVTISVDHDETAERVYEWAQELPEAQAENARRCHGLARMGVHPERSGQQVSVRVTGLPAVLEASLADRLCSK